MKIKLNRQSFRTAVIVALLVIVAYSMRFIANRQDELNMAWFCTSLLRSFIYIGLFAAWGVSVCRRVIQTQARNYLSAISALLVFWMAVRTLKYMIYCLKFAAAGSGGRWDSSSISMRIC